MDESIVGEEAPLLSLTVRASDVRSRKPASSAPSPTHLRTHVWSVGLLRTLESQNMQLLELLFLATVGYQSEVELERI
jgi:hypothetical protein